MPITVTTVKKPEFVASGIKQATYAIENTGTYTTGGESWDLSTDFDHVSGLSHGVAKDIAQTTHWFCIFGTLVTGKGHVASTVKLGAVVSATGVQAANGADLTGVDELIVTVTGS